MRWKFVDLRHQKGGQIKIEQDDWDYDHIANMLASGKNPEENARAIRAVPQLLELVREAYRQLDVDPEPILDDILEQDGRESYEIDAKCSHCSSRGHAYAKDEVDVEVLMLFRGWVLLQDGLWLCPRCGRPRGQGESP